MARKKKINPNQQTFAFMRPKLPICYGDCLATIDERRNGKTCKHWTCRHNLVGEITRMGVRDATRVMCAMMSGKILDSCALDVAEERNSPRAVATLLGTGVTSIRKETRAVRQRFKTLTLWDFHPWEHPECWAS